MDDPAIRALNRQWLGRDRATDVLSFSMREGRLADPADTLLGDVVVSLETALRIARRRKIRPDRVVARLLVHGVLHLLGHDHVGNARRRAAMQAEERRLLRRAASRIPALGVAPRTGAKENSPGRSGGKRRGRVPRRGGDRRPRPSR